MKSGCFKVNKLVFINSPFLHKQWETIKTLVLPLDWIKCSVHTCAYQRLISSVTAGGTGALKELAKTSIIGSYMEAFWLISSQRNCQASEIEFWLSNFFRRFGPIWWTASSSSLQRTDSIRSRTGHQSGPFAWGSGLQVIIFTFLHRPIVSLHKTIRSNGN